MRIQLALEDLHRAESDLAADLLRASERHKVDHEVFYLGRDLATWSHRHVRLLTETGRRYGLDLDGAGHDRTPFGGAAGEEEGGRQESEPLRVLRDLREIYVKAAGVSVDWELLGQAAQGVRDVDLLALTQTCHPDTLRQMRWANAKLKSSATQILVS